MVSLGERSVVFDETGTIHLLDATTSIVLSMLDGTVTPAEVARTIAGLGFPLATVHRTVEMSLHGLRAAGLLEEP